MTKEEFLQELRIALQGRIPQAQVNEHLLYYEAYILEESRKGRTVGQVVEYLGDPRLLAKTLIEMQKDNVRLNAEAFEGRKEEPQSSWRGRFGKFKKPLLSIALALAFALLLALFVTIGALLLPLVMGAGMIGAMLYVIYLIFFGNKK